MSDSVDTVVIGAGVVGLAIARALALAGREVVVLEKNRNIGEETSSRNSEVIHAGLYYAAGSLKAKLCVEGKQLLYAYCESKGIEHRRCGKLIVATHQAQRAKLDEVRRSADAERSHGPRVARRKRAAHPRARGARSRRSLVAVDRDRR